VLGGLESLLQRESDIGVIGHCSNGVVLAAVIEDEELLHAIRLGARASCSRRSRRAFSSTASGRCTPAVNGSTSAPWVMRWKSSCAVRPGTVKLHLHTISTKLKVDGRTALIIKLNEKSFI
jgi:hypothetical protein